MKTPVGTLIRELQKFPLHAETTLGAGQVIVHTPDGKRGTVPVNSTKRSVPDMGDFAGWMDPVFTDAGDRIRRWLLEHPTEARDIALAAIAGLYLDEDWCDALPTDGSNPRGAGTDYVDEVGGALERNHIMGLIEELQAEADAKQEEEEEEEEGDD